MIKDLILCTLLIHAGYNLQAQIYVENTNNNLGKYEVDIAQACNKDSVYLVNTAEFAGGISKFTELLNNQIVIDKKLKGKIEIKFLVNCKGEASGYVTTDYLNGSYDGKFNIEILEVFDLNQKWNPAMINGKAVDSFKILEFRIKKGIIKSI